MSGETRDTNEQLREHLYSLLDLAQARAILDLGCGDGHDLLQLETMVGGNCRLVGIDSCASAIKSARQRTVDDHVCSFLVHDVANGLPFDADHFDVVFSKDTLECLTDKDALIREVHRVLRPNGQVVFAHWDWDSQVIDGDDKALVRKILQTFNDWKQDWMTDCDAWMGRRLWRVFNRSGLFRGEVHSHVLMETEFAPGRYGYERIADFEALARRGMITGEEYNEFRANVQRLAANGEYFYSITSYVYVGRSK